MRPISQRLAPFDGPAYLSRHQLLLPLSCFQSMLLPIQNLLEYIRLRIPQGEVLLLLLGASLWLPGLRDSYFLSDDFVHLADWGLPPLSETWTWFYRESAGFYRPLTALWWKSQYLLWGMEPLGYQFTNLLLHIACTFLVRDLARQLFPTQPRIGLWAGLFFLFLPGHIFGVLMIAALTGLLCSLFYLTAATTYLRGRTSLSLLAFVLALLTKELALSLPLLIATWEAVRQYSIGRFIWRDYLRATAPFALIGLGYVLVRYLYFGHLPHSPMHENANPLRLLTNAAVYAAQMITPWGLQDFKPFFRGHPQILLAGAACGFGVGCFFLWKKHRQLSAGHLLALLWVGIALAPVIRLYSPWSTYLPAAGVVLLLVSLISQYPRPWQKGALALFLSLSIVYSLLQQQHWHQARLLCRQVVEAVAQKEQETSGTIYLANLPAEWDGAPLLVGDWVLEKALRLRGAPTRIVSLSNAIHFQRQEAVKVSPIDAHTFELKLLSPPAFFRIDTMEALSGRIHPQIGYTYTKDDIRITVAGLDAQGQPNHLRFDMGNTQRLNQVWVWDRSELVPLLP